MKHMSRIGLCINFVEVLRKPLDHQLTDGLVVYAILQHGPDVGLRANKGHGYAMAVPKSGYGQGNSRTWVDQLEYYLF